MPDSSFTTKSLSHDIERLFRRIIDEAFTRQEFAVLDEVISPDITEHQPGLGSGPEGVRDAVIYLQTEDITVGGDKVWARLRAQGTQEGPHMGHSPTGKQIDVTVIDICRFENGKMVEHWGVPDRFMIMAQLGMLPPPR